MAPRFSAPGGKERCESLRDENSTSTNVEFRGSQIYLTGETQLPPIVVSKTLVRSNKSVVSKLRKRTDLAKGYANSEVSVRIEVGPFKKLFGDVGTRDLRVVGPGNGGCFALARLFRYVNTSLFRLYLIFDTMRRFVFHEYVKLLAEPRECPG